MRKPKQARGLFAHSAADSVATESHLNNTVVLGLEPEGFAVVGMAALFTAIVRAPVTAIVLVTEMTANTTMLMPMIVTCFAAMLVARLFGDISILDSLRERMLAPGKTMAGNVHK